MIVSDKVFIFLKPQRHDYLLCRDLIDHRGRPLWSVWQRPAETCWLLTQRGQTRNPFCVQMTLKSGLCIIYQSDSVVTFIRKLLQHSLLFSTGVKHFNLYNILITQCHGAACHPHFLIYSLMSLLLLLLPLPCLAQFLSLSLYFMSRLLHLFPLYPSPSHKEMWIEE